MLLKTILNHVERHTSFVYQDGKYVTDRLGQIRSEVRIAARNNGRPIGSGCPAAIDRQAIKLEELLRTNLKTVRAYLMREDFQRFWEYRSPTWAKKFLEEWCQRALRSRIEPLKKMARTLRKHQDRLLTWLLANGEISSGTVEGFNNKAKLTRRKASGFRTANALEIALFHNLGELPEPEFTHRFS